MKKILIIDDDEGNLEVMTLIFLETGYEVKSVCCEAELWKAITQFSPELIFIDILLGETNGVDLCGRLKQYLGNGQMKIVLLSACNKNLSEAERSGCADGYMAKPFDFEEINNLATRLLEN